MTNQQTLEYNSERDKMIIPEYGRNVQKMIDFACTIEDREERNKCANAIISVMGQLAPHLRDIDDFNHKLWAHLFIMSDFKLDVDSPYPIPSPESFKTKPERLSYPSNNVRFGHYGKSVEKLIAKAIDYDEGDEKDYLVSLIANLMKKCYVQWNQDSVKDETIINDLDRLSNGKLHLKDPECLISTNDLVKNSGKRRNFTKKNYRNKGGKRNFKKRY